MPSPDQYDVRSINMIRDASTLHASEKVRPWFAPARAAKRIVRGIKRNRYLIFTSPEIRFGYLGTR